MGNPDRSRPAIPTDPDRSRPVDNVRKVAGNCHFPDHPDQSRPDAAIPTGRTSSLADLRASLRQRWERDGAPPADGTIALASAIRAALAEGAEREADAAGWLVLVRQDGRRLVLTPDAVAALAGAGALPELPEAVEHADAARRARPSFWTVAGDPPRPGDRCLCGGRQWWRAEDGATWWCEACHPSAGIRAEMRDTTTGETGTRP